MQLKTELHAALSQIFYSDSVDEWLSVTVDPLCNKLASIVNVACQQIQLDARVKTVSQPPPTPMTTDASDTTTQSSQQ